MSFDWKSWVLSSTDCQQLLGVELIQELWSGYGELLRLSLGDGPIHSVILKRVVWPSQAKASVSDRRKRRSYEVEQTWYRKGAPLCDADCRVAQCYGFQRTEEASYLLLEDLKASGFAPVRRAEPAQTRSGLRWLAHFHSRFLGMEFPELWEQGTYWHLDTRQQEWQVMPDGVLKEQARALDLLLKSARYQTLIHGDAKTPNFCWSPQNLAAAVDFQYVGQGCGIRDVALFLERALGRDGCESAAQRWLDVYFESLGEAMGEDGHGAHFEDLKHEWRALFPVAWSDYSRFRLGWGAPSVLDPYSEAQLRLALEQL